MLLAALFSIREHRAERARRAVEVPSSEERGPAFESKVRAAAAGDPQAARDLLVALLPRARNLVRYLVRGGEKPKVGDPQKWVRF